MVPAASAEAEAAAETPNLVSTMPGIDKLISEMVAEETIATAEENMATVPRKGKEVVDASLEEKDFDLRHLGGEDFEESIEEEEDRDDDKDDEDCGGGDGGGKGDGGEGGGGSSKGSKSGSGGSKGSEGGGGSSSSGGGGDS
eukprot:XP_008675947.1 keratin, type II cytoskeletal 1-like [Zea mays]